jgi:hypothetical protein
MRALIDRLLGSRFMDRLTYVVGSGNGEYCPARINGKCPHEDAETGCVGCTLEETSKRVWLLQPRI